MEMESLHKELGRLVLDGFKRLNKTKKVEHKKWKLAVGSWDVSVVRGPILEKATATHLILNTKHPVNGEDTRFNVFQVMVYPANPKIPILLFNMENRTGREDIFAGFVDVAPVAADKTDLRMLQSGIRKITENHGEHYETLRCKLKKLYHMDPWKKQLNAGIGIRLDLLPSQYAFLREAALNWVEAYFEIVEKRRKEPFTEKEESLMYSVRARIMEFYLLKDLSVKVAQKLGVPLEALSLGNFAPVIRY